MKRKMKFTFLIGLALSAMIALSGCGAGMDEVSDAADPSKKNAADLAGLNETPLPNAMSELTPEQAKDPKALEAKADSLVMHGDMGSAMFIYQRALKLGPKENHTRLNTKIAFTHLREGRFQIAYNILNPLPKNTQFANHIWLGIGLAQVSLGWTKEAEAALKKSIKTGNASWKAYNALGVIYNKHKDPNKALGMFDQALRIQPKVAALYNNRGLTYMMLGEKKSAESSFWQALKLDNEHKLARNNLALLLSSQNRWDEARSAFSRTVGEARAHNNVGVLMAHGGEYLGAGEQFRQAVEKLPTYYSLADQHLEEVKTMAKANPAAVVKPRKEAAQKPKPVAKKKIKSAKPITAQNQAEDTNPIVEIKYDSASKPKQKKAAGASTLTAAKSNPEPLKVNNNDPAADAAMLSALLARFKPVDKKPEFSQKAETAKDKAIPKVPVKKPQVEAKKKAKPAPTKKASKPEFVPKKTKVTAPVPPAPAQVRVAAVKIESPKPAARPALKKNPEKKVRVAVVKTEIPKPIARPVLKKKPVKKVRVEKTPIKKAPVVKVVKKEEPKPARSLFTGLVPKAEAAVIKPKTQAKTAPVLKRTKVTAPVPKPVKPLSNPYKVAKKEVKSQKTKFTASMPKAVKPPAVFKEPSRVKLETEKTVVVASLPKADPKPVKFELIDQSAYTPTHTKSAPAPKAKKQPESNLIPAAKVIPQIAKEKAGPDYTYHLQVACLKNFKRAQKLMNSYMSKGYSCQLVVWVSKKGKRWFRLLLGPFESKGSMKSALASLKAKEGLKDYKVIRRQAG